MSYPGPSATSSLSSFRWNLFNALLALVIPLPACPRKPFTSSSRCGRGFVKRSRGTLSCRAVGPPPSAPKKNPS